MCFGSRGHLSGGSMPVHVYALAHIAGFGDESELADEWRDW